MSEASEQLLYEHLGERSLAYLLAVEPERLRNRIGDPTVRLSDEQEAVLVQLLLLDAQLNAMEQHDDLITYNWRSRLSTRHDVAENSIGNVARQLSGGAIPAASGDLPTLESHLAQLTIEVYPALLVKEPSGPFGFGSSVSLHAHPLNDAFQLAARTDRQLGAMFTQESEHTGPSGSTLRSTGHGGGHQLWTFAETLIASGWRLARSRAVEPSPEETVEATLEALTSLRQALSGEGATVPSRVGLTGVLLPEGVDELDLGWARLRRSDERDQLFVKATTLEGQLTTTNSDGQTIAINYSGDVVLEFDVPYVIRLQDLDPMTAWPEDMMVGLRKLDEIIENVRLGLLLALPEARPVLASAWRAVLDPLTHGIGAGWSDVTRTPGLVPVQLTDEQATEWQQWAARVGERRIPTIGVALRRMLAAIAERHAAEDVLVDAVIVWENLFGAKTETTLRVTSSLAWLLGESAEDRRARQTRYKKIYAVRSDVVHGAAAVNAHQLQEFSLEAVRISIDALRAVFSTHVALLGIKTSEDRSLYILHEG